MKSNSAKELHSLIHSLTRHEKRYLKLYADFSGKRKENNYLHLFAVLHDMQTYDDAEMENQIRGSAYETHLPSTIFHLYQLILRALKSFHANRSETSKLRESIESVRILLDKAQFQAALRLARRARKKAKKLQANLLLLEILELEKHLLFRLRARKLNEELESRQEQTLEALEDVRSELMLSALRDKQRALRSNRNAPNFKEEMRRLSEMPLLLTAPKGENMMARMHYASVHGHDALYARDHDTAYQHFKTTLELWDKHPEMIPEVTSMYISSLNELLNACIFSKRYHQAEMVIDKLREIPIKTRADEIFLLNQSLYTQLFYCINVGNFERGTEVITQIGQLLEEHESHLSVTRRVNFYHNSTILLFLKEDYRQALRWLTNILHMPSSDLKQHVQDFARIFQLVLHYELENYDLVEYLFRSSYRYYRGKRKMGPFEEIVFTHIKQLVFAPDKMDEIAPVMYEQLWDLARQSKGIEPTGLYELIFWTQSKNRKASAPGSLPPPCQKTHATRRRSRKRRRCRDHSQAGSSGNGKRRRMI